MRQQIFYHAFAPGVTVYWTLFEGCWVPVLPVSEDLSKFSFVCEKELVRQLLNLLLAVVAVENRTRCSSDDDPHLFADVRGVHDDGLVFRPVHGWWRMLVFPGVYDEASRKLWELNLRTL
jgi:hypothetical protein